LAGYEAAAKPAKEEHISTSWTCRPARFLVLRAVEAKDVWEDGEAFVPATETDAVVHADYHAESFTTVLSGSVALRDGREAVRGEGVDDDGACKGGFGCFGWCSA